MARDARELAESLVVATESGFRSRLLARGQAQSMIRRDGDLPEEAPQFSQFLDRDLLDYSYALLSTSLRLLEATEADDDAELDGAEPADPDEPNEPAEGGSSTPTSERAERIVLARDGFIQASYALEAATRNADPTTPELAFHRLVAGAASHLAGYAARAWSLMEASRQTGRLSPMEETLADLVMRDLDRIEVRTEQLRTSAALTDEALVAALQFEAELPDEDRPDGVRPSSGSGDDSPEAGSQPDDRQLGDLSPIVLLLSENYISAVSTALFAISFGQGRLLRAALADLELGEHAANDVSAPGPWWVYRLSRRMLNDLFETSIRSNIPTTPPPGIDGDAGDAAEKRKQRWTSLRLTYVAALLARGRSEIDLWPSQLHVVDRIFTNTQDLVVALPTSAGKTRIAELCILSCLAQGQRAVYVTPLRALSAQTEQVLERTFAPLGARVSSLYGSIGVSDLDEDALRASDIVVATPEKLDFALRSDPTVLDDVGLVVLDEGHMIGPGEREVRYEAQIQRLLRRADAATRRIICLSAVFPSGDELDDFVAWITNDSAEGLHREDWRPTSQRFGLVEWREDHARLTITLGDDQPFIPRYFEAKAPTGRRSLAFPKDQNELTVATAWRLVEDDQAVLVYCPQRRSVEPFAKLIVKLHQQGLINSLMPEGVDLANALTIGTEWFGRDHPILGCLKLGVAIHHGALPGPFRREIERLLHLGVLKITVASPTLAQGLNLSASAVLFQDLHRSGELLTGSEFSNVIGRAGRPFVDTEGLVLYPLFSPTERARANWLTLTAGESGKSLTSGLIAVSVELIRRMLSRVSGRDLQRFLDYLTGGPDWSFPIIPGESGEDLQNAAQNWQTNLALLDTAILSIVGDEEAEPDAIIQVIADTLRDSLWERQMRRLDDQRATILRSLIESRAQHLWATSTPAQRRGWYLAGLGADAGVELAGVAPAIVEVMHAAERAIAEGDLVAAGREVENVAAQLFAVSTFSPSVQVNDWRAVLAQWVTGRPLGELNESRISVAQFIESDLIYRLVWGMEAARVYESAQGNPIAGLLTGSATAAIEAGTLNRSTAILLRSGFDHRAAAIVAVNWTGATFDSTAGMREWIRELDPLLTASADWPTPETHGAWEQFADRAARPRRRRWRRRSEVLDDVEWFFAVPEPGAWMRVTDVDATTIRLWSPGYDLLGAATVALNRDREGVLYARRHSDTPGVTLHYRGPGDLLPDDE
jgi:superfamily II DNA/RNA helicase